MKTIRKSIAIFLVLLTLYTTCSVSMPVFAAYENVTSGNVTDGNIYDVNVEKKEDAKILSEITEKRDRAEKHFLMSDGTFMVARYPQPVHYQNSEGEWLDYDNTLSEADATTEQINLFGTEEIFSTNNQVENVVFAKKSNSNTLVSYEAKDYPISFNYQSAKKSNIKTVEKKAELEGDDAFLTLPNLTQEVLYENVFNKVDLQYFVGTDGLKENIILKDKNAQNTFTINYNIGSLSAEVVDRRTINLMSGDELIYTISAPYMYDANGEKSENVTLTVKKNKNGKLTVVITADSTWIQAEDRVFPVTIDPSIITERTTETIDSIMIASSDEYKNYNFSEQSETVVGAEKDYGYCRALTRIDLPKLNKGDIIVSAQLNMCNTDLDYSTGYTFDMQVNAHMITSTWDIDSVTWNTKPDCESVALDYDVFEDGGYEWRHFDITKAAKAWYSGTANNGIMLKSFVENESIISNGHKAILWVDRYNGITDYYPAIVLTYRNNKGLEDYWTYTSLSAGTAGSAYINDYTGNLVFASNAVSTSNELMPLSIDCIYNGYVSDVVGFVGKSNSNQTWLGRGWRFSVQQTLIASDFYGLTGKNKTNYPYVYTDGDGTEHYIYYNEDDDVYEDEDGLGLTLTLNKNSTLERYTLTDKKDNTLKFNSDGNLVESRDANGNKITITYDGKKIRKVTDGSGKVYEFIYVKTDTGTEKNYVRYIRHPSGDLTTFQYNLAASLAKIIHTDGTVSLFTYEDSDDKAMLTAKDSDNYQLSFGYTLKSDGKRVETVTEYGKGTQGQKITFDRTKYNSTKIQTAGTDGVYGNANDLVTTYQFDNFGKTVTQQLSTDGGVSSVAGVYEYTEREEASLKSSNKVTSAASLGRNVVNHVINGNAEKSSGWSTGVASATATYAYSSDAAYIGQKSILVNTTAISSENGTANAWQSVTGLTGGKSYTLSAYVKTTETAVVHSGNSTGAYIALRTVDSSGNKQTKFSEFIPNDTSTSINKGWRRLVTTIQLPADCTTAYLYLGIMNVTGKAYFDCIQLEEGAVANDFNLVENSSFENHSNGMPTGWTASNTSYTLSGSTVTEGITSGYKKDGSYSMRITGDATKTKRVSQEIYVNGNKDDTYILSGWAIANATKSADHHKDATFRINIYVYYYDGDELCAEPEEKDPLVFNADFPAVNKILGWQYSAKAFSLKSKDHPAYKPGKVKIEIAYDHQINGACFDNIQLIKDVAQSYVYDDEGNVVSVSANAEQKDNIEYDEEKDDIQSYTDAAGFKTTYNFNDETHNLEKVTSPGRVETYFTYDAQNGNQTETLLKSQDSALTIKNETRYTEKTDDNPTTDGSYVAATSDEHGNETLYYYNIIKDLTKGFKNVLDVFTHYVYDDSSEQLVGVYTYKKDENENRTYLSAPVLYTYDKTKLSTINYGSDTYSFTYDNFGNVVSTNVGGKPLSTNSYGANNGVLQSTTYGNGAVKNYTYDTFGNLAGVGDGSDTQYTWTYDSAMNPMIHVDNVNGLRYNYEYDGIGRLVRQELRDSENATHLGATEYTYDLRNNVTRIANEMGGRTVKQWYYYTAVDGVENSARYAKENLPVRYYMSTDRHLSYNYDSLNRLTRKTLSTSTPLVSTYSYKMSNREANKDADDTNSYRTTQVSTEHSNKLVYFYEYDIAGNITNIKRAGSDGAGNRNTGWTNNYRSYTYDDLSQLTSETNATTGKTYTYTYDNVGNITSKSDGTSTITYTYGTDSDAGWSKLLTSYNGETIDYDSIGNPVLYRGANLTWTGRQLDSYTKNGTSITYTYDADGLRGSKTINGAKSIYQYVDGTLLYEDRNGTDLYYYYDSYGTITAISAYLPSGASGHVFVGTNSLGDVNALYNANGEMIVKYEYDAWGKVLAETDANGNALTGVAATWSQLNPFRYRGYYYDVETGLYYLQSRYYDADVGRFLNSDGYVSTGQGALGHNMFAYCNNNPINFEDPSGFLLKKAANYLEKKWNEFTDWLGGLFGAESTVVNEVKVEEEHVPQPINYAVSVKTGTKTTTTLIKNGNSSRSVSGYSEIRSDNVFLSSVGVKANYGNSSMDVSLCLEDTGICFSNRDNNVTRSVSLTVDRTQFKVGLEFSTTVISSWDRNTTITNYTNISVTGWTILACIVLAEYGVPVGNPTQIPRKAYI